MAIPACAPSIVGEFYAGDHHGGVSYLFRADSTFRHVQSSSGAGKIGEGIYHRKKDMLMLNYASSMRRVYESTYQQKSFEPTLDSTIIHLSIRDKVSGNPIIGATISLYASKGVVSDFSGRATLTIPHKPMDTLLVQYFGYTSVHVPLDQPGLYDFEVMMGENYANLAPMRLHTDSLIIRRLDKRSVKFVNPANREIILDRVSN